MTRDTALEYKDGRVKPSTEKLWGEKRNAFKNLRAHKYLEKD